jgi:hypothetical protein
MKLYDKLETAVTLLTSILEELRPGEPVERSVLEEEVPEILLRRSQRNRRSEKNEVMGLAATNGAPAVPESWIRGGIRAGDGTRNRQVLAKILHDYEPLTRCEIWSISKEMDPRLKGGSAQKNFQQLVNRMLRVGQLRRKRDKIVMGKGA